MSKLVVPDSIEPYLGWKALTVSDDLLLSPQQYTVWPPGQRLEAVCSNHRHQGHWRADYGWRLVKGVPPQAHYYIPGRLSDAVNSTATPTELLDIWDPDKPLGGLYYAPPEITNYSDPPDVLPPDGYYWFWDCDADEKIWIEGTPIAGFGCTCGIYATSKPATCQPYFRNNSVLAQVALWGTVTLAHVGSRGQYAYPQKLIIPKRFEHATRQLVEDYAVPYELADDATLVVQFGQCLPDPEPIPASVWLSVAAVLLAFCGVALAFADFGPEWLSIVVDTAALSLIGMVLLARFTVLRNG